jgi:ABC-type Mn2+/Zn2+ transport system ATPase subunit
VDVSRTKIRDQLTEVGFDDTRQSEIVGGLSGGWKMKLELARAMLYNADLLLLDEVRFNFLFTRLLNKFAISSLRIMSVRFTLLSDLIATDTFFVVRSRICSMAGAIPDCPQKCDLLDS